MESACKTFSAQQTPLIGKTPAPPSLLLIDTSHRPASLSEFTGTPRITTLHLSAPPVIMFLPCVYPSSSQPHSQPTSTMGFLVVDPKEQFSMWKEFTSVVKPPSWRRRDATPRVDAASGSSQSSLTTSGSFSSLSWSSGKK
ncbi:hypothetical protein M407DRAFT_22821 [Tulasnella calospora MUT 4182]|uniref:Uncharacterized protein n=1 Tax=Tulasnella calospora MUT 4182 TaxID=1051891 RepID=A0A0C3QM85_9AGAM|nr:hypothetical protein M407DRAFT_22821 [Tulasnella calospora MUT 4182]